jgi:CTP-dependent riboflavin kinase
MAGAAAAAGLVVRRVADRDRERRRAALLSSLQPPVLQLAARRGAQLTVTETAAELGWSLRRAEKVLQSLDDGVRVSSEVTDEGVIVYEFRELARSLHPPA